MPGRDVIVMGASAGGVEALRTVVAGLRPDLPAAVFVVLHIPAQATSALPTILSRAGPLPASHPTDGEPIRPGRVYVAPPDRHLLIRDGRVRVVQGPRENRARPAIDPLFRTAARWCGPRVTGLVLSGTLDDGTAGLRAIKRMGGIAVVQEPSDALFDGMPRSAIANVAVDHVLPAAAIPALLTRLAGESVSGVVGPVPADLAMEADMAEMDPAAVQQAERPGVPSPFSCPDCGGVLREIEDGTLVRFRCRVGHAYSADTLVSQQTVALDDALWVALRALEEKAAFAERLVARSRQHGHAHAVARFDEEARDARARAEVVRTLLVSGRGGAGADAAAQPTEQSVADD